MQKLVRNNDHPSGVDHTRRDVHKDVDWQLPSFKRVLTLCELTEHACNSKQQQQHFPQDDQQHSDDDVELEVDGGACQGDHVVAECPKYARGPMLIERQTQAEMRNLRYEQWKACNDNKTKPRGCFGAQTATSSRNNIPVCSQATNVATRSSLSQDHQQQQLKQSEHHQSLVPALPSLFHAIREINTTVGSNNQNTTNANDTNNNNDTSDSNDNDHCIDTTNHLGVSSCTNVIVRIVVYLEVAEPSCMHQINMHTPIVLHEFAMCVSDLLGIPYTHQQILVLQSPKIVEYLMSDVRPCDAVMCVLPHHAAFIVCRVTAESERSFPSVSFSSSPHSYGARFSNVSRAATQTEFRGNSTQYPNNSNLGVRNGTIFDSESTTTSSNKALKQSDLLFQNHVREQMSALLSDSTKRICLATLSNMTCLSKSALSMWRRHKYHGNGQAIATAVVQALLKLAESEYAYIPHIHDGSCKANNTTTVN